MTLELFIYILFCIFALYYAYKGSKVSEMTTLKAIVAFFIGVIWFFIVRLSGFDIDINTYAGYLDNTTFLLFINSSYFLREFVFWGIFIGGNLILQDSFLTFLFIDLLVLFFLIRAIINFKLPFYSYFLLLCFFPNLMGYENVYRQYISTILTLYAISLGYRSNLIETKKELKSYVFLIIAGFCHNVAFLFFPLLFFLKKRYKLGTLLSMIICGALPIISSSKSEMETGDVPVYFFLVVILVLYMFYLFINSFKLNKTYIYVFSFIFILIIESIAILTGAASKRIIMFALDIILIFIVISLQSSRFSLISYRFLVLLLCISMLAPTFLSNSSFQMLLTTNK
jgi:hypothetical protein